MAALDLRQDWDIPRWRAVVWQRQHPASALLEPQVVHNEEQPSILVRFPQLDDSDCLC